MMKKLLYYPVLFISVVIICVIMIQLSACIPAKYIEKNSRLSAEYYLNTQLFERIYSKENENTTVDNYADSVLLNIIYCQDNKEPLKSAVCAGYYSDESSNAITSYDEVTKSGVQPNVYYSRYWHGTMIFLKPLLMITDIQGIKIFNVILLSLLSGILAAVLIKEKEKALCASIFIGMFITGICVVPFCIEYMSSFAVMLAVSIIMIFILKNKEKYTGSLFLVSGMLICFFDFLTSETLTFTVPAVIALVFSYKYGRIQKFKDGFYFFIRSGLLWIFGYGFMFLSKWGISYLFLKGQAFDEAISNASVRINSIQNHVSGIGTNRVFKNFVCLNIFDGTSTYGEILGRICIICAVIFSIVYLYKKKHIEENELFKMLCLILFIPYIRYIVLNNHSELHYFFTYRAQMPVLTIISYMIMKSIDIKLINKELKKIRKIFK